MIRVTWEWLGADVALDIANTVAVANGVEHDLLRPAGGYERWAHFASASPALGPSEAAVLREARSEVLRLRDSIRAVLRATASGKPLPTAAVVELNRVSRRAAEWLELGPNGEARTISPGRPVDRLLAAYARSAMEIAAAGRTQLRSCPAPSCGMFYRPRRDTQRWCSTQCGTRARVARHYRAKALQQSPAPIARSGARR